MDPLPVTLHRPVEHTPGRENGYGHAWGLTAGVSPIVPDSELHLRALNEGVPDAATAAYHMNKVEVGQAYEGAFMALLADNECEHGALPHDTNKPAECRCWTTTTTPEREPARPAFTREDFPAMPETATAAAASEAPYGFKADGTPRKKPAPSAATLAKAAAARRSKSAARALATPAKPAFAEGDFLAGIVGELERRITELKPAHDEYLELVAAREALT